MKFSKHAVQAGVVVWVAVALSACSRPVPPQEPVRSVKVMAVAPGTAEFRQEYAGEVRARSESRLGFRVGGKLVSRPAEVGQRVQTGQLLAQLDATDYQLASQAALAAAQAARTQRDVAAADAKRYAELRAQNFISGAELERREAALKAAQATLDQATAQSSAQTNQKSYTALVADRGGVVLAVDAEPGQVVAAGTPVVRLAVDGPRDVVVAVPEHRAGHVRVGMKASVRLWASDQTYSATVREVAASADPVTRTFQVKLAIPPASDAGGAAAALGSTAYVRFDPVPAVGAAAPVLIKLPTSALWQQGQGSAVWLFDAGTGTVQSRQVVVATADGNEAVIASGLVGGEQVVVAGVHVLAEGQNVTLFQEKNEQKVPSALTSKQKIAIDGVVKP